MRCPNRWRFASLLVAATLLTAQVTPVIFERTEIRIDPVATIVPAKDGPAPAPRTSVSYNVEVRSEDALKLEFIPALNTLTETTGVVIAFTAPSMVALPRMQDYTAVDALFVAEDGTVLQIYPGVVLAELTQDVYARDPVKAFVFLKAGEVTARHILPRDIIAGSMFYPAPPMLQ